MVARKAEQESAKMEQVKVLPKAHDERLTELVARFSESPGGRRWKRIEYSLLYPMWGDNYEPGRGIMVVGRATNGWVSGWDTATGVRDAASIVRRARDHAQRDRMEWVMAWWADRFPLGVIRDKLYPIRRSAFWQVACCLAYEPVETAVGRWATRLAWSNLYKIAPADGGNPTRCEIASQQPHSVELLRLELDLLRPRAVVMMVGSHWIEPFAESLDVRPCEGRFVVGKGQYGDSTIIVTVRPEGKPRTAFVDEVRRHFAA